MKKLFSSVFIFISLIFVLSACGGESYADKLKKETKAIDRFIDAKGIKVVHKYPTSFENNIYYRDPDTGVYIHVANPGNDDKPIKGQTDVYIRYKKIQNLLTNDTVPSNYTGQYLQFRYGVSSTYTSSNTNQAAYYYLSSACVSPLDHDLGNNAIVNLIVPSSAGSTSQQNSVTPYFYEGLVYRFVNDEITN